MAITPQAIKDQEFQVKFRGYDTIEVKAYLELIAEEFFERLEELRQQIEEIETLSEEKAELEDEKQTLKEQLVSMQEDAEAKMSEITERNERLSGLNEECDLLKDEIEKIKQEKAEKDEELAVQEEHIQKKEKEILKEKANSAGLQQQIDVLKKTSEQLGEAEIDFKSTLVMAQKFSNDIKEKSEAEAQEILDIAVQESEKLRQDTFNQLARYPKEIAKLKEKRDKVRAEMKSALSSCLEAINVMDEVGIDVDLDEVDDLYQSIELPGEDLEEDFSAPEVSEDEKNPFTMDAEKEEMEKNSEVVVS